MHLTSIYSQALFLAPILISTSHALDKTYWVDSSCTRRTGWSDFIGEAFTMARRAGEKLGDSSDTDYANVFRRIFSTGKDDVTQYDKTKSCKDLMGSETGFTPTDTAYNLVHGTMSSIGNDWRDVTADGEQARLDSLVRIYCDNAAHFVPNSGKKGGFKSPANKIRTPEICGTDGLGFVSDGRQGIKGDEPAQNPKRVTMTICDKVFDRINTKKGRYGLLTDVPEKRDMSIIVPDGVKVLKNLVSMCILHEFTHVPPYVTDDKPQSMKAYGWENIIQKLPADAVQNADNYAYMGVWAILADRKPGGKDGGPGGHTLARPWDDKTSPGGTKAEQEAVDGLIKSYKDLTGSVNLARKKRGLKARRIAS